jgi:hypothetical protein
MSPTRILPELNASLMCEAVRQEANGNLLLVGVVDSIRVPQLPVTTGRFCIFNRWTMGVGRFSDTTRLVAPDRTTMLCEGGAQFELRNPAHHATNIHMFANIELKTAGAYFIEVLLDNAVKLRAPLAVILAKPSGLPAPNAETELLRA